VVPIADGGSDAGYLRALAVVLLAVAAIAATWAASIWWFAPCPPSAEGSGIVVDKARNRLYLYVDGRPTRSYPVATGREAHLTPEGRFHIACKLKDPHGGPQAGSRFGSRWLGLATPGHEDGSRYGIHGTLHSHGTGRYRGAL